MTESNQLDLVAILSEQMEAADTAFNAMEDVLNPSIDANPDDKLLMEILDYLSDARESLQELRDTLQIMQQRDLEEIP